MRHRTASLQIAITLALATTVWASAKTTSWKSPDAGGRSFKNLAVFAMTPDKGVRRAAETVFTTALGGESRANPSHTFVTDAELQDREKIVAKVKAGGYDGVIVFRVGAATAEATTRPYPATIAVYATTGGFGSYWGVYGVTGYAVSDFAVPATSGRYTATDRSLEIESTLYDAIDGKLVWAAETRFTNPRSTLKVIEGVVKATAGDLRKEKLIR